MVYELKFNSDYDGFTGHRVFPEFETPQEYFQTYPDIDHQYLLVEIRGEIRKRLYMVVYHPTARTRATHPWTHLSLVRELSPWGNQEQVWKQNVEAYFRDYGLR